MGYRRGYDCDICGKSSEDAKEFIGLRTSFSGCCQTCVDDADFHVCLRCSRVISHTIIQWDSGAERRQRILNGEAP